MKHQPKYFNHCYSKPWGSYFIYDIGKDWKIKKLIINPGQETSLQSHESRKEWWSVLEGSGKAIVFKYDEPTEILLEYDKQVFVDMHEKHKIINNGDRDLIILELQTGNCFEDDIIRYEDIYGRVNR